MALSAALAAVLSTLGSATAVRASGEERTTIAEDVAIKTDTRWAGGVWGGYLPVRVQVTNRGGPRVLSFAMVPTNGKSAPTVRRTIAVDPNATVRFTLAVPLLGPTYEALRVFDGGTEVRAHLRSIAIPGYGPGTPSRPALLVISDQTPSCLQFVNATHVGAPAAHAAWAGMTGGDEATLTQVVPPSQLPETWIDYSALDIVAISRDDLDRLERSTRSAILRWVQCGGNLIVFDVGKEPRGLEQVERLIGFSEHAAASAGWQPAEPRLRPPAGNLQVEEAATMVITTPAGPMTVPVPMRPGAPGVSRPAAPPVVAAKAPQSPWPTGREAFSTRELMLGTVSMFPENPFPGQMNDWSWYLSSLRPDRFSWTARQGMSPQIGTDDFFKFLVPGIRGVPTVAFLLLITVFAFVIGPVNYFYLRRKKLLSMLLVTVPAMAFATTVLLLGYSVAAHGFSVRSRIRSLTVLDQKSRTAVTMARLAMFAGVAPSGGLRFSPETAVYPVLPPDVDLEGPTTDWTETQALASGWMPSRTRVQFVTTRNAEERSRVELRPAAGGRVELANGLPWDIEAVVACDENGRMRIGRDIAANGSAVLDDSNASLKAVVALLDRYQPEVPPNFVAPPPKYYGRRSWMTSIARGAMTSQLESGIMERRIRELRAAVVQRNGLPRRSYLAVLSDNPNVETGVPSTKEKMGYHLILGYY